MNFVMMLSTKPSHGQGFQIVIVVSNCAVASTHYTYSLLEFPTF